jgi:hypothetical protein
MNLYSSLNLIANNLIANNYNVGGGQIGLNDPMGDNGATIPGGAIDTTITGNIILTTSSFGGDQTAGVETTASYVTITGNSFVNLIAGVSVDLAASHIAISGNVMRNVTTGIMIINPGTIRQSFVTATGNDIQGTTGINLGAGILKSSSFLGNNLLACTTAIANVASYTDHTLNVEVRNNTGYNGVYTGGEVGSITVGASPFTYWAGISPEMVYISGGVVTSVVKQGGAGAVIATQSNISVMLDPNQGVAVYYSAAPTMVRDIL